LLVLMLWVLLLLLRKEGSVQRRHVLLIREGSILWLMMLLTTARNVGIIIRVLASSSFSFCSVLRQFDPLELVSSSALVEPGARHHECRLQVRKGLRHALSAAHLGLMGFRTMEVAAQGQMQRFPRVLFVTLTHTWYMGCLGFHARKVVFVRFEPGFGTAAV
jgi:hypothetical protein